MPGPRGGCGLDRSTGNPALRRKPLPLARRIPETKSSFPSCPSWAGGSGLRWRPCDTPSEGSPGHAPRLTPCHVRIGLCLLLGLCWETLIWFKRARYALRKTRAREGKSLRIKSRLFPGSTRLVILHKSHVGERYLNTTVLAGHPLLVSSDRPHSYLAKVGTMKSFLESPLKACSVPATNGLMSGMAGAGCRLSDS